MKALRIMLVGLIVSLPFTAVAAISPLKFDNPAQEKRFQNLIAELRCLVCQNQSLADSNAELAQDLRREVYTMIKRGDTDKEITEFLVARYSDFVLYRPPFQASTLVLWVGPFVLLFIAAVVLWVNIRRQIKTESAQLSDQDHQRAKALLDVQGSSTGESSKES